MAPAAQSAPIRVGLIGAGNWANHGHLRVLALLPEYEVVAIQARRPEAARAAAGRFGIATVAESEEGLLAVAGLDLVLVLNTAPQHAATVRKAIAAGKDVYCEWPLTVDSATAAELVDLANAAGVRIVVGLQRRLAPHNRYVRDLIAQGYVGKLRSVRLHVSTNYFQATLPAALRWTIPAENFSDVVAIYAGHFLDMLFHAVGRPSLVSAILANQFPVKTVEGTGETFATTAPDQLVLSGLIGADAVLSVHVEGGKRNGSGVQVDITGDEGDLRVTNTSAFGALGEDYVVQGARGDRQPLGPLPVPDSYRRVPDAPDLPSSVLELADLYAAFARDRAEGTATAPTFGDALWLHRFFDAMDVSATRRVQVEPD